MDKSKTTEPVRRLTDQEVVDLRAEMQKAAEWMDQELARRRQEKSTDSAPQPSQPALVGLDRSAAEYLLTHGTRKICNDALNDTLRQTLKPHG